MQYHIPQNVSSRFTFFGDFGFPELMITLLGVGMGFLLQGFISIFISHLVVRLLIVLVFGTGAFLSTQKTPDGSLLELLKKMKRWKSNQRRYLYGRWN